MSNHIIKNNSFQKTGTINTADILATTANIDVNGSRQIFISDNSFLNCTKRIYTNDKLTGTITAGNTSVVITLTHLLGDIGQVVAEGSNMQDLYVSLISGNQTTLSIPAALGSNQNVYIHGFSGIESYD